MSASPFDITTWGGGLRKDWPNENGYIITCPSCEYRHGAKFMCDARWALLREAEQKGRD